MDKLIKQRNIDISFAGSMNRWWLFVILAVALLFSAGCQSQAPGAGTESPAIAVSGAGKISTAPDQVQLMITVASEGEDAATQQENAEKVQDVIDQLLELGLSKDDIQTAGASFYPKTRWEDGREINLGFRAESMLRIETKKMDLIGQIIDKSVAAGAERVGGLSFTLSDQARENLLADVLEAAVNDARSQAELTLQALGQQIGGVKHVEVIRENQQPIYRASDMMMATAEREADPTTPVIPGEVDYQVRIIAEFYIR